MTELAPLRCPRCGRFPTLRIRFKYAWDSPKTHNSCHILKYECRKWLGIRLCYGPHKENWIDKEWFELGQRVATERWNEAVDGRTHAIE